MKPITLFCVLVLHFIILVDKGLAKNPTIENPVLITRDFVQIYFLPYYEKDKENPALNTIIKVLAKTLSQRTDNINYDCFIPKGGKLDLIYTYQKQFTGNKKRITRPISGMLLHSDNVYLVGVNSINRLNKNAIEIRLFKCTDGNRDLLLGRRFSYSNETSDIINKVIAKCSDAISVTLIKDLVPYS